MIDKDAIAANIAATLERTLDALATDSDDKGVPSISLTQKQREKLLSRLTSTLMRRRISSLPKPIDQQLLRQLRDCVRPLDAKGPHVLRYAIEALEEDGFVVRRVAWAELKMPVVGVDPEAVSRIDSVYRRSSFLRKQLEATATMSDAKKATLAVAWVMVFDGLASGSDVRSVLRLTVDELLELDNQCYSIRLSDDKNPSSAGPRRVLIDPCAAWLFHNLPRRVALGDLITSNDPDRDATKIVAKYLRGTELRKQGLSDLNICIEAIFERIRYEAGSLIAHIAAKRVKSFCAVPSSPKVSECAVSVHGMSAPPSPNRQMLEDFLKVGENMFNLQQIGIALKSGNASALNQLLESLPEDSVLLNAIRAADRLSRTDKRKAWKPGLRDCATLVWQIFGDARSDDLTMTEIYDGLSDFILSAEPEVGREFFSRVIRGMQEDGNLPASISLHRVFGYGLTRLSVDTRLITEQQYATAKQRLLDSGDFHASIALLLGFRLGLRPGEIYRLQREDVDPVRRMSVTIRGQVKTPAGRRALPAFELLTSNEIEFLLKHRLSLSDQSEWFLPGADSKAREAIIDRARSCLAEVCGDPALPMYRLRHSFASRWFLERHRTGIELLLPDIAAQHLGVQTDCPELRRSMEEGTWMYQLAYLLGHSGPGVTLLHYIHTTHYALYAGLGHTRPTLMLREACALTGISRTVLYTDFKVVDGAISLHDLPPIPEKQVL